MQYRVLEPLLSFETSEGTFTLYKGQMVNLPKDIAMRLLEEGKIEPVKKAAYKIYSKILDCYLWIVETDQDMNSLRDQGVTEAIYTNDEVKELQKLSREDLKAIHEVKETFKHSKIEAVSRGKRESHNERDQEE
jgi:hypothetical protein